MFTQVSFAEYFSLVNVFRIAILLSVFISSKFLKEVRAIKVYNLILCMVAQFSIDKMVKPTIFNKNAQREYLKHVFQ